MAIIDAEGIVTKETKYGDTSRILTVVTKELGKISILAGNVRKGKSGLLGATSLFSHSRFTL
ncbi:MAG: recombination protein O N-terminal domain-containing protein, partial [Clostridia bacterium]|nr:recombination protein O N-terminal domain-containing protein [Clostridia bacterium]